MRRRTLVLGMTSSAIAVALVALVDGVRSHRSAGTIESTRAEADQAQQTSSADTELNESTMVVPQRSNDNNQGAKRDDLQEPEVTEAPRKYSAVDEAISRKEVREEVTRDVRGIYPLLIGGLDLTSSQQDALLLLLIEDEIARTRTSYSSGIGMDEQERSARIAALIGEAKLQQFLALEHNIDEYREVHYVQSMLQQKGVPLTDTQQDGLLKILIDVREQVDMKRPAHIKPRSVESLEHTLNRLDEYERLALELAPSMLSAKQLEYMFERYQALSYGRADALELHRQQRADNPDDEQLLWYPSRRN